MTNTALSAIVITFNEERNIQQCLQTLAFCGELIVVDSGSTDNTVNIAKNCGARIFHQEWLGYGLQKQFAVNQASYDWVLCLDADERLSQKLQSNIKALDLNSTENTAYRMPRRNHFMGKALAHGEGYPDLSVRLFNRNKAKWSQDAVHEGVETTGAVGTISGDLLHFSEENIAQYIDKQNRYTSLQADALYAKGKRCKPWHCLTSPLFRFIKFYFLRRGFLDGLPGFVHISIGCMNAFLKYAKLLEKQKNKVASTSSPSASTSE